MLFLVGIVYGTGGIVYETGGIVYETGLEMAWAQSRTHTVQPGDTLWSIAARFGLTPAADAAKM